MWHCLRVVSGPAARVRCTGTLLAGRAGRAGALLTAGFAGATATAAVADGAKRLKIDEKVAGNVACAAELAQRTGGCLVPGLSPIARHTEESPMARGRSGGAQIGTSELRRQRRWQ